MSDAISWLRDLPILLGSFFVLTAAIGVLRFPDLYTRLHASTKLVTLGSISICFGAYMEFGEVDVAARIVAVVLFLFLTSPVSAYMISRASYLRGLTPVLDSPDKDEWRALGTASGSEPHETPQAESAPAAGRPSDLRP